MDVKLISMVLSPLEIIANFPSFICIIEQYQYSKDSSLIGGKGVPKDFFFAGKHI